MRQVTTYGDDLRVLAVDPGGTTGWLLFRPTVDEEQVTGYGLQVLDWGEERDQVRFLNMVWSLTSQPDPSTKRGLDAIVCEAWENRPGVPDFRPEAIEILGTLRWFMADDRSRFSTQFVSQANSFGTDAKIRPYRSDRAKPNNVGRGGNGHAIKALQHAVLWVNTRWSPGARP